MWWVSGQAAPAACEHRTSDYVRSLSLSRIRGRKRVLDVWFRSSLFIFTCFVLYLVCIVRFPSAEGKKTFGCWNRASWTRVVLEKDGRRVRLCVGQEFWQEHIFPGRTHHSQCWKELVCLWISRSRPWSDFDLWFFPFSFRFVLYHLRRVRVCQYRACECVLHQTTILSFIVLHSAIRVGVSIVYVCSSFSFPARFRNCIRNRPAGEVFIHKNRRGRP